MFRSTEAVAMMWMSRQLYEILALSFHPVKLKQCFKI